jgi:RNA-binding protein YhbY
MSLAKQSKLSIARTKKLLKHNFRQFLAYGPGGYLPLSLEGHAGIGKTSLVNQVAKELAESLSKERNKKITIKVRSFQMSAMQPFDLSGYPMIDENTYPGRRVQRFATPEFLVEAEMAGPDTYTILFFDEWNRARTEMHNAFMGYIDGRGVNGHEVPRNVFCVAAANPVTDDGDYGAVTEVDDQAILRRLIKINVVPTSTEFMDFLYGDKTAHTAMQAFLEEDKSRMPKNDFEGVTSKIRNTNAGNVDLARAVTFVAEEIDVIDRKALIRAVAQGIIGDSAGDLFVERFGQCEFLTTPEELILKGSSDAFGKIKAAVGKDVNGENRLDQVTKVVQNMIRFLNEPGRTDLNKTQATRLNKFLDLVPQDMRSQVLKKSKFTDKENKEYGLGERLVETLNVTSGFKEGDLEWR